MFLSIKKELKKFDFLFSSMCTTGTQEKVQYLLVSYMVWFSVKQLLV